MIIKKDNIEINITIEELKKLSMTGHPLMWRWLVSAIKLLINKKEIN